MNMVKDSSFALIKLLLKRKEKDPSLIVKRKVIWATFL